MKTDGRILTLCLGLLLVLGACSSLDKPANRIDYYTLEYEPIRITGLKPLPFVIKMERFMVAPIYNTDLIIYRDKSFKRAAYTYHKWRANPGDLVSHFLTRDIKESGLFKAVLPYDTRFPSSYMLEGTVDDFFEWDMKEAWEAALSVSITLMAENEPEVGKRGLFQKTYRAREACKQKNPLALSEAMSSAMAKISEQIIKEIHHYLKDYE